MAVLGQVDRLEVSAARVARLDPRARDLFGGEDGQRLEPALAAGGTDEPEVGPLGQAQPADKAALRAFPFFAEHAHERPVVAGRKHGIHRFSLQPDRAVAARTVEIYLTFQFTAVKLNLAMRRFIFAIFLAFLLFFPVSNILYAQTDDSSSLNTQDQESFQERLDKLRERRIDGRENLQKKHEQLQQRRQETREKIATKTAEIRKQVVSRIKSVFLKILRRYEAALARLDKIAERLASRIDKLKTRGVDTSQAEEASVVAESLGLKASVAIDEAKLKVDAIDPESASVKDAVMTAKDAVKSAKQALKDYHRGLANTIVLLKASAGPDNNGGISE